MSFENIIGIVAGILTSASMLPQLVKVIKEKDAKNLSLPMILILISGLGLWVYYGFLKREMPIILSNSFAVLVNLILLVVYLFYHKKARN